MDDLLNTIKERYAHYVCYRNFATTTHRSKAHKSEDHREDDKTKGLGLFDIFKPQITGMSKKISQKIHDEIAKLMERRDKTVLQRVSREMPTLIQKHTQAWKKESFRIEKLRVEAGKRSEKRVDLFIADTSKKIQLVKRDIEQLKLQDKIHRQKQSQSMLENPPLLHKTIKKAAQEYADKEREELRKELSVNAERTERRIMHRLRNEEQYEKRRRG